MEFNILENLNVDQRKAVTSTEGYIRVIAGAGSGKTKALISRYVYLVNELGISTANILCVTFTNKASKEMKKRIRSIIGDNDTGLICTFHGFCRQLLREDIHTINYPNNFIVMDTEDMSSILKIVYEQANISSREYTFLKAKDMINARKGTMEHIPYILELDSTILKEKFLFSKKIEDRIFFGYLYQQRKNFNLDFSDLITFAVYILNTFSEKRKKWQKRLEYVMVDEFQDVSSLQYEIVSILSEYHKNLFVVGDPDQTIYSWRGARIEYILNFDKQFQNVKTILMNTNYRSTENILKVSNSLIDKNEKRIKKELKAIKKSEIPVVYNHFKTIYDEARWISNQIKEVVKTGKEYNDICILYRAHYVSRSIEEIFMKENIPYILYSGVGFYERKEIKDVLSYLRMIVFEDDLSFLRVVNEPKRNFGKKKMEIVQTYAEKNKCSLFNALKYTIEDKLISNSKVREFIDLIEKYQKIYKEMTITDLLAAVLNDSGYEAMLRQSGEEDRLNNLSELKNAIVDYEITAEEETYLEDYLQEIALYSNSDLKEEKDKVKMMTIHTAKGLEFPYVFVCGLNEGIFPSQRANTKDKLEEERRLAYVSYTRAENALFLSEAEGFNYDGSYRYPSRFIFNIDKKYLNYTVNLDKNLVEDANEFINLSEKKVKGIDNVKFKVEDRVRHSVFGLGKIKEINVENSSYIIKFNDTETDRNISFTAKLSLCNNLMNRTDQIEKKIVLIEKKEAESEEEIKLKIKQKEVRIQEKEKIRNDIEQRLISVFSLITKQKEQQIIEEQKEEKLTIEHEKFNIRQVQLQEEQEKLIVRQEREKIISAIREQEEIFIKNKYKFFGKGAKLKKKAKDEINRLNNILGLQE